MNLKSVIRIMLIFALFAMPEPGLSETRALFRQTADSLQISLPPANPHRVIRQEARRADLEVMAEGKADQVLLNFFGDVELTVQHSNTEYKSAKVYAWYGEVKDDIRSWAVLVVDGDRFSGIIRLSEITYKIRPLVEDWHLVREIRADEGPRAPASSAAQPASATSPLADEYEVLNLVNGERADQGLHGLTWNDLLFDAARNHSLDMATRNYFSHTSQDGRSPGDRISAAGYNWRTYGENIAYGYSTPAAVMAGWMNSSGHRANILNRSFCELGVGLAEHANSNHYPYWTQNFGTSYGTGECTGTTANQQPVARMTARPTSGTAPLSVQLDASNSYDGDGTIVEYRWDFGDGQSGNGVSIEHTYMADGSYTVRLTVEDDDGATASITSANLITVESSGSDGGGEDDESGNNGGDDTADDNDASSGSGDNSGGTNSSSGSGGSSGCFIHTLEW